MVQNFTSAALTWWDVRLIILFGFPSCAERFSYCRTPHTASWPDAPYLLDHLWMLLHDVQKAVTLLVQGCCPLFGATWQLLEEVCHDVVQAGAAACAYHGVWKKEGQGQSRAGVLSCWQWLGQAWVALPTTLQRHPDGSAKADAWGASC